MNDSEFSEFTSKLEEKLQQFMDCSPEKLIDTKKNLSDFKKYHSVIMQAFVELGKMLHQASDLPPDEKKQFIDAVHSKILLLDKMLGKLDVIVKKVKTLEEAQEIQHEMNAIERGEYQDELFVLTYGTFAGSSTLEYQEPLFAEGLESGATVKTGVYHTPKDFYVYPILNEQGIRCNAAIACEAKEGPIEIQLNFFGTIDFDSTRVDMEFGGPGQQSIKKFEKKILEQMDSLIRQVSIQYPGRDLRLRVAGHSLGGALAKSFTHTLQRAIAVQNNQPDEIIKHINKELETFDDSEKTSPESHHKRQKHLDHLHKQLQKDSVAFNNMKELKKISGITLYANGGPGVSSNTDHDATLMTYYQDKNFLRVYNHFHKGDTIVKFGDHEFLSGKDLPPRTVVHKTLTYEIELANADIQMAGTSIYPGVTAKAMAAHIQKIYGEENVKTSVTDTISTKDLTEKVSIKSPLRALAIASFGIANIASACKKISDNIKVLKSYASTPISKPIIMESHKAAANTIGSAYKKYKAAASKIKKEPEVSKDAAKKPTL